MTKREEVQNQIGEWLILHKDRFNAPYGILPAIKSTLRGKIRTITFGIARYLDAIIEIWSPNLIRLRGEGPLAYLIDQRTFESAQDVIDHLSRELIKP